MYNISIPIDDYIDKTFKIHEEEMICLPKKNDDNRKFINISMSIDDHNNINNIDDEIMNALTDGFINGYIESHKDLIKELLKLDYCYDDIIDITGLSVESVIKIENEL